MAATTTISAVPVLPHYQLANGTPVPAVTATQMKELDRLAEQLCSLHVMQMAENDGRLLADLTMSLLPTAACTAITTTTVMEAKSSSSSSTSTSLGTIVVLVGKGGNGAGGIAAARHLANRGTASRPFGCDILVCYSTPVDALEGACKQQRQVTTVEHGSSWRHGEAPSCVTNSLYRYCNIQKLVRLQRVN
jgi:hypothetical protein